jgi:mono/diheme cytochrome c family protein
VKHQLLTKAWLIATGIAVLGLAPAWSDDLVEGTGKNLVLRRCTGCHEAALFTAARHTKPEWKTIVDTMIGYGADMSRADAEVITDYLAMYYGPAAETPKQ